MALPTLTIIVRGAMSIFAGCDTPKGPSAAALKMDCVIFITAALVDLGGSGHKQVDVIEQTQPVVDTSITPELLGVV